MILDYKVTRYILNVNAAYLSSKYYLALANLKSQANTEKS